MATQPDDLQPWIEATDLVTGCLAEPCSDTAVQDVVLQMLGKTRDGSDDLLKTLNEIVGDRPKSEFIFQLLNIILSISPTSLEQRAIALMLRGLADVMVQTCEVVDALPDPTEGETGTLQ